MGRVVGQDPAHQHVALPTPAGVEPVGHAGIGGRDDQHPVTVLVGGRGAVVQVGGGVAVVVALHPRTGGGQPPVEEVLVGLVHGDHQGLALVEHEATAVIGHVLRAVRSGLVLLGGDVDRAGRPAEGVGVVLGVVPHVDGGGRHELHEQPGCLQLGSEVVHVEHRRVDLAHQLDLQLAPALGALVEEGLSEGHLAGAGLEHHGVDRSGVGEQVSRADQHVDLAAGTQLELVEVRLGGGARAPAGRTLGHRRAEGEPHVGRLAPPPRHPVQVAVVEDAEPVRHVGVVDQQLAVGVLQQEHLGMQGVGLLQEPLLGERGQPGHPAIPLGVVGARSGHALGGADGLDGGALGLDPPVEGGVQPGDEFSHGPTLAVGVRAESEN